MTIIHYIVYNAISKLVIHALKNWIALLISLREIILDIFKAYS